MVLIQILLPATTTPGRDADGVKRTRAELVDRFGGVTAYTQTPAQGEWRSEQGSTAVDNVVLVEVVAPAFDRAWWATYASTLAQRFSQDTVHIRAMHVELLDPDSA